MPRSLKAPCRISRSGSGPTPLRPGFTLLEVMLALGIMSVVAVALFASLHVAFKSKRTAEAVLEPVRAGEAVMEMVRTELEGALPPRGVLAGPFVGRDWRGDGNRDDDDVSFYTAADAPAFAVRFGEVKRVELTVVRMEDTGELALARRVIGNLLAPAAVEPDDEILVRGVAGFNLRYFDGQQWWDSWDSTRDYESLPRAVEVTLELDPPLGAPADAGGARLVRIVQVPCAGEPDPSDVADEPLDPEAGGEAGAARAGLPGDRLAFAGGDR